MVLSALELPVHPGDMDGLMVLRLIDSFLTEAAPYVIGVAFDAATCHQVTRRFLMGNPTEADKALAAGQEGLQFFPHVTYKALPEHPLPRLPVQICMFEHKPVVALLGPCHAVKNCGGQTTSTARTLQIGKFWVDLSGALRNGMPHSAYRRADPQSDRLHALTCCPFYFIPSSSADLGLVKPAWSCRGALLFSLLQAFCAAPFHHKNMSVAERLELALTGYVAWDLVTLTAARMEAHEGVRVGSMSMATVTTTNLQNLCLSMVCLLLEMGAPQTS